MLDLEQTIQAAAIACWERCGHGTGQDALTRWPPFRQVIEALTEARDALYEHVRVGIVRGHAQNVSTRCSIALDAITGAKETNDGA